jgi:hypothetical protein
MTNKKGVKSNVMLLTPFQFVIMRVFFKLKVGGMENISYICGKITTNQNGRGT